MKKAAFLIATVIGLSAFAQAPADVTVKCDFSNSSGAISETVTIPYGAGEKKLILVKDQEVIVQLERSELSEGTLNLRLFLSGSTPIAIAKGVAVSQHKMNGVYVVSTSAVKENSFSISCGI